MKRSDEQKNRDLEISYQLRKLADSWIIHSSRDDSEIIDVQELAKLVAKGHCHKAFDLFQDIRECIPKEISTYIVLRNSPKHKVVKVRLRAKGSKKVFKKGMGQGILFTCELTFPSSMSERQIAMGLASTEKDILDDLFEFEYDEPEAYDEPEIEIRS